MMASALPVSRRPARDVLWLLSGLTAATLARFALNGHTSATAFAAGAGYEAVEAAVLGD